MSITLAQAILTASRAMPADNGYALVPDTALRVLIEHAQNVAVHKATASTRPDEITLVGVANYLCARAGQASVRAERVVHWLREFNWDGAPVRTDTVTPRPSTVPRQTNAHITEVALAISAAFPLVAVDSATIRRELAAHTGLAAELVIDTFAQGIFSHVANGGRMTLARVLKDMNWDGLTIVSAASVAPPTLVEQGKRAKLEHFALAAPACLVVWENVRQLETPRVDYAASAAAAWAWAQAMIDTEPKF